MTCYDTLMRIYQLLLDRYGPQHWWPGETRFEIMVGAVLTQNTNWQNVEKAIANLKAAQSLTPQKLNSMDTSLLASLIRPAGYYNIKATRLKNLLNWLFDGFDGDPDALDALSTDTLRQELLAVKGIGKETADSIILYALDRPVFVVDTYTCRILGRHALIEEGADYEQTRQFFQSNLAGNVPMFNEYHALLVRVGKEHCRTRPKCQGCPLETLPHNLDD